MVQIDIAYTPGLRCVARHGPSGATVATDAPVDNHGRGESFSPTDLVATALGACMLTVMGITAERHGWSLEGSTAQVVKEMVSAPLRRIGRLRLQLRLPNLDERARITLERIAHTCPVHQSLHPEVAIDLEFAWGAV
jgi:putative redox protein